MIQIDGSSLTLENVVNVSQGEVEVVLSKSALRNMSQSNTWVREIVAKGKPVYGINTGFGIFANKQISAEDTIKLNRNLIISHAVGTGPELPIEIVRAAMLIRANTLAAGFSGVRPIVVETLINMLNKGVIPTIPSQGSLGSSGDLAPLSHFALVLSSDAGDPNKDSSTASYQGEKMPGFEAMKKANIDRIILEAKEGLGLTNGATFSAALAALTIHLADTLLNTANLATAMSLEALLGASDAFDDRLHQARRNAGQIQVASQIRNFIHGSTLINSANRIQDAYSLRCAPQVHGPVSQTIIFAKEIISPEINAATDNPLLFDSDEAISGGNFHGEPVGLAMDYLKIALAEIGAISERRIFHLTDETMNAGLPPMLVNDHDNAGVNSGLMMPQYTAASLVLENQALANPNSIHSLPTSGGKEDHNANAMTAARNAFQVAQNVSHILAVELFTSAHALDIRLRELPNSQMGIGVTKAHGVIRNSVTYHPSDSWWGPQIEAVKQIIKSGELSNITGNLVDAA